MDKTAFIDAPAYEMVKPEKHHVIRVLSVTVGVLALGMVAMIVFTAIYITHVNGERIHAEAKHEPNVMTSYEVDIALDETTVHERVIVNENQRTEFIINWDPRTGFIKSLAVKDFRKNITGMYDSNRKTCFLTPMDQASLDFAHSKEQLKELDGGMIDTPAEQEYTIGNRVQASTDIAQQLKPYCSARNTFWLVQMKAGARIKRGVFVTTLTITSLLLQIFGSTVDLAKKMDDGDVYYYYYYYD